MIFLKWFCGIAPLACLILAYWWEHRPQYKKAENRRLIEKGYGFLLDKEEHNAALGDEEVLIQKPLQKPKIAMKRRDSYDTNN